MLLEGEKTIGLPREKVWTALNDPDVLKRCVPGCDTFEEDGPDRFKVGMAVSVGPIKARFTGTLTRSDIVPDESYSLTFEGSGGAAGFGKGTAQVKLTDLEDGTSLAYSMSAQVGGKLAQVGARLIDGVSKKLAEEFFSRFVRALQPEAAAKSSAKSTEESVSTIGGGLSKASGPAALSPFPSPAANAPPPSVVYLPSPPEGRSLTSAIAVLGAAISAIAASVAVLAATLTIISSH